MATIRREIESPGPLQNDSAVFEDQAEGIDSLFQDLDGFEVSRALPRYVEKTHSIRDLILLLDAPDGIELEPPYQRDFVWNVDHQMGIIDSLFQGYYVPGLIFNRRVETVFGNRRTATLVCIDGKQRLTSVKRFTDGLFPCHDRHGKKWWFQPAGTNPWKRRNYLSQAAKNEFWKKTLSCYEYVGMTEDQEHELFERVQRGSPLTIAERSQAKKGDWHQLAWTFKQDFPRVSNVSDNRRGAGHDKFISSFVQLVGRQKAIARGDTETQFIAHSHWVQKYFVAEIAQNPCTTGQKAYMRKVFDRFDELARTNQYAFDGNRYPSDHDNIHKKLSVSPIEFVAVAFLIDQYGDTKSNPELADAIRLMRRKVHAVHENSVRRKHEVWETLMESVRETLGPVEASGMGNSVGCNLMFPTPCRGTKRALPDEERGDENSAVRRRFIAHFHGPAIKEERY